MRYEVRVYTFHKLMPVYCIWDTEYERWTPVQSYSAEQIAADCEYMNQIADEEE